MHLHGFYHNDGKFVKQMKEVNTLQTYVLHYVTCHVLWVGGKIHSSFDLELKRSSILNKLC